MARYNRDMDRRAWNRGYDVSYGAGTGGYDGRRRMYERGFEIGPSWGGGSDVGYRTDPARGLGYGRGMGDRLHEYSNDPSRGAHRPFSGRYDRAFYGNGRNYGIRGEYPGYGPGYDLLW